MKKFLLIAIILTACFGQVSAEEVTGARIEINLPSRTLCLYMDGVLTREYPVCVGTSSTPTPQGEYRVIYKTVKPNWINKGVVVPPGPANPLGERWIGITKGIGIHGNNNAASIGTYASAGCIRMYNRDVEELYELVPAGTPVSISYERTVVFEDKYSGEKAVILYPDSYRQSGALSGQQHEKLLNAGIPEPLVKKAGELLKKSSKRPRVVSDGIGIFLNNSPVTCDSFAEQGEVFINNRAAEEVFGVTAGIAEQYGIGVKEADNGIYVSLTQAAAAFGGSISYDPAIGNAYVSMKLVKVNGAFAGLNNGDLDRRDHIAAEALRQLEYDYAEDAVDINLFGKMVMKVKKNKIWCVDTAELAEAMKGSCRVESRYGITELSLPVYIRYEGEYFSTETIDGSLALSPETIQSICDRTGWAAEAFSTGNGQYAGNVYLEPFLQNFEYSSNNLKTVIDIRLK
ncbi:MAG: L,D-transpeptidase [Pseudomonadota bacterium]